MPIPFVIVADLRTGSTLLSSSLDQHPQVRCLGELFHTSSFPDNDLPQHDRLNLSGRQVVRQAFSGDVQAAGFRAMIFLPLPDRPQWADAWDALRNTPDLRVISLLRRDKLAQYASVLIAERLSVWHPSPGDPVLDVENRPTVRIDPADFRRWRNEREDLLQRRLKQLAARQVLELEYESLTEDWPGTIHRVQTFLGVPPLPMAPSRQKQERRPLREIVENYAELMG
jgi:LPS sulfotransferase NodH